MARFFFNVRIADALFEDPDGSDLVDFSAASEHAVRIARGVMSSEALEGRLDLGSSVEIQDHNRRLILTLPFRDAICVEGLDPRQSVRFATRNGTSGPYLRLVQGSLSA
jgi:hypothetical protein